MLYGPCTAFLKIADNGGLLAQAISSISNKNPTIVRPSSSTQWLMVPKV